MNILTMEIPDSYFGSRLDFMSLAYRMGLITETEYKLQRYLFKNVVVSGKYVTGLGQLSYDLHLARYYIKVSTGEPFSITTISFSATEVIVDESNPAMVYIRLK